jgi:hypothetical protein
MAWICPQCGRTLTREKIGHQCIRKAPEDLFAGKPDTLYALFEKLHAGLLAWPGVQGSATKNCMVYVHQTTFLVVKPMKSALDLKFYLAGAEPDFPVYKTEQWGARSAYYIRLFEEVDLDKAVWSFLRRAYEAG